ncbi:MAG: aldehyde dehydrogenase family protein [Deltaproteobacteria bacterium]|nr:aldehyde dehydrogenase family protein [Deltaproteobacteria bacterium]
MAKTKRVKRALIKAKKTVRAKPKKTKKTVRAKPKKTKKTKVAARRVAATPVQKTISPVDGSVYVERPLATPNEIEAALAKARRAQRSWAALPVSERARLVSKLVDALVAKKDAISTELTWQMGRPIRYSPNEIKGFEERARYMVSIAAAALADVQVGDKPGFVRYISREPLGVVFVVAPWNYPFLTSVNAVVPALLAGNSVLLKHSSQTPLVAERYTEAGREAGLPEGVLEHLHLSHGAVASLITRPDGVDYVAFTGSVGGGNDIYRAVATRFIGAGLELGGKDPAYVRADANLKHAIDTLVDGACYNSGQSCCGTKRIYVHHSVYDAFIDGAVALTRQYKLGNPTDPEVTLGPVVRTSAAEAIRKQVERAVKAGARALIDDEEFAAARRGTPYMAPQIVVDVTHQMEIMREETFGPVVGVMRVQDDDEAVRLMNDNRYGLTAAVFTSDQERAVAIGKQIETGTWFMNRCDYLDPALAWVGVKDSGRGCTLSKVGYEYLTRPKSFHLKIQL